MITLAEFFGKYRALVEDGLTSNARQSYARAWALRVEPSLGSLPLTELNSLTIANARAVWTGADSTKGDAIALLSKGAWPRGHGWPAVDQPLSVTPPRTRQGARSRMDLARSR